MSAIAKLLVDKLIWFNFHAIIFQVDSLFSRLIVHFLFYYVHVVLCSYQIFLLLLTSSKVLVF